MSNDTSLISVNLKSLMHWQYYVQQKEILPRRRVASIMAGKHVSKMRGRGLDFEEVRNYVPGDDIRNIDWKVTARTKKTHSKVFVEEKERPSVTILDQSGSMFFGTQKYMKSVIAAESAALHAFRTVKMGDRFGGWVFNDETIDQVKPQRSQKSIQQFLKLVEKYNNKLVGKKPIVSEKERLNEVLFAAKNTITHDYVVSIISDFVNVNKDTFKYLINLSKHNDIILIQVTDPLEEEMVNEKIALSDGSLQIRFDGNKYASKMKEKAISKRTELSEFANKYGLVYIALSTGSDLIDQVKKVFANA